MLVKAQCTNCGGNLEVDNSKEAAICPFCNTPYIVEKAINQYNISSSNVNIQNATITYAGKLDADSMFENWLITKDSQLEKDFLYYYASDPRKDYFKARLALEVNPTKESLDTCENIIKKYFNGDRFAKYRESELVVVERVRKYNNIGTIMLIIGLSIGGLIFLLLMLSFMF